MKLSIVSLIFIVVWTWAVPLMGIYQLRYVQNGKLELPTYMYQEYYETFRHLNFDNLSLLNEEDVVQIALNELQERHLLKNDELMITQSHSDLFGVVHVYCARKKNGYLVDNQVAAVHLFNGEITAISSSINMLTEQKVSSTEIILPLADAIKLAEDKYGLKVHDYPPSLKYVQIPNGDLVLVHQFQIRDTNPDNLNWLQVSVDVLYGQIVQVVDFGSSASYEAIEIPKRDVRDGFSVITNPDILGPNPAGWHSNGYDSWTTTVGNNVNVSSYTSNFSVDGGESLDFKNKYKPHLGYSENINASIINGFYVANAIHDIFYQFGFDEPAGNFQENNFDKGGLGGDSIHLTIQERVLTDAKFFTPEDGQRPTLRLFVFPTGNDAALDNTIIIHELAHGLSQRLTGGPMQVNCLREPAARAMNEGWSDAIASILLCKKDDNRDKLSVIGNYASGKLEGLRTFPYSTNMAINPLTFGDLKSLDSVHSKGAVWASALYEVYWNLVDKYGFSENWYDSSQTAGNILMLNLIIGGLKHQSCNPGYIDARDSIFQTDINYFNGRNQCLIWKGFAKRGLGYGASFNSNTNEIQESFKLPPDCSKAEIHVAANKLSISGPLLREESLKIVFDTSTLAKQCMHYYVCVGYKYEKKTCFEFNTKGKVKETTIVFEKSGENVVYLFTQGPARCFTQVQHDGWGYQVQVSDLPM